MSRRYSPGTVTRCWERWRDEQLMTAETALGVAALLGVPAPLAAAPHPAAPIVPNEAVLRRSGRTSGS